MVSDSEETARQIMTRLHAMSAENIRVALQDPAGAVAKDIQCLVELGKFRHGYLPNLGQIRTGSIKEKHLFGGKGMTAVELAQYADMVTRAVVSHPALLEKSGFRYMEPNSRIVFDDILQLDRLGNVAYVSLYCPDEAVRESAQEAFRALMKLGHEVFCSTKAKCSIM